MVRRSACEFFTTKLLPGNTAAVSPVIQLLLDKQGFPNNQGVLQASAAAVVLQEHTCC